MNDMINQQGGLVNPLFDWMGIQSGQKDVKTSKVVGPQVNGTKLGLYNTKTVSADTGWGSMLGRAAIDSLKTGRPTYYFHEKGGSSQPVDPNSAMMSPMDYSMALKLLQQKGMA